MGSREDYAIFFPLVVPQAFLVVWFLVFWFLPSVPFIEVENLSGSSLDVVDGNASYTLPVGDSVVTVVGPAVQFSGAGGYSFTHTVTATKTVMSVGSANYTATDFYTFEETFIMGSTFGIPIVFALLALRAVKQLGYHSGDI